MKSLRGLAPLLALLCAGRFLAFVARLNIVPFYPELMSRLSVTYTGVGGLFTAFFVGYALSLIPAGQAADRWIPRWQFALGVAVIGGAGAVLGLATSYGAAVTARVVEGVAVAALYTASLKLLAVEFTIETRGRAMALMEGATALGTMTALSVAPLANPWMGYQAILLALPGICAALLVVPFPRTSAGLGPPPGSRSQSLRAVFTGDLGWVVVVGFLGLFAVSGVMSWMPTHLTNALGYTKERAGLVMGVVLGVQILAVYPGGLFSDRMGRRLPLLYAGSTILLAGLLGLGAGVRGAWIVVVASLLGVGMSWAITPVTVLTMEKFGAERAGLISAMTIAGSQAGSGFSGVAYGWVLDRTGSFRIVWLLAAVLMAARVLAARQIREAPRRPATP